MAAEHDRDWGGGGGGAQVVEPLSYGCAAALGVGAGGGVQGEGSSENVQGSGWLRIHLPAVTVQQQLQ